MFSVKEVIENYSNLCIKKAASSRLSLFFKAIFAGAMIGFGAAGSNVAAHNISNVGLSRLTAAVVFPVGLMMVVFLGAELFTGDCLVAIGVTDKKIKFMDAVRILFWVWLGNLVGGTLLTLLVYASGQLNYTAGLLGAYSIKVAIAKTSMSFGTALASGILCNFLVAGAVLLASASKDATGKLLACFFVIMLFVTSGYEHCVANMYYITAGLVSKFNPTYVKVAMDTYGITQAQLDGLNLFGYFVKNLVPVTIGNIVGGSFALGVPLLLLNRDKAAKA